MKSAVEYDWGTWLMGILRSLISGGASAVAGGVGAVGIDPNFFNLNAGFSHTIKLMVFSFCVSGFTHMMMFLSTHGTPEPVVVTKEIDATIKQPGMPTQTIKAVETTTTAPVGAQGSAPPTDPVVINGKGPGK